MKNKVYISGKITGLSKEKAQELFNKGGQEIKSMGMIPIIPIIDETKTWQDNMRIDIQKLCTADGIYMLSNHKTSKGAKLELLIAKKLGLFILNQKKIRK